MSLEQSGREPTLIASTLGTNRNIVRTRPSLRSSPRALGRRFCGTTLSHGMLTRQNIGTMDGYQNLERHLIMFVAVGVLGMEFEESAPAIILAAAGDIYATVMRRSVASSTAELYIAALLWLLRDLGLLYIAATSKSHYQRLAFHSVSLGRRRPYT